MCHIHKYFFLVERKIYDQSEIALCLWSSCDARKNFKLALLERTFCGADYSAYWRRYVKFCTYFLQVSYPGILCWYQTNQSMCCKARVDKSHVKLKALQFLPWSGKSNRIINHMQPSPTAKLTSLKMQIMWELSWRLQMPSSRTLVYTNAQYQFHQISQIISWQR